MNYHTNDLSLLHGTAEATCMESTNSKSNLPLNLSTGKTGRHMDVILPWWERESGSWCSSTSPFYQPRQFKDSHNYQINEFSSLRFSHQHFNQSPLCHKLQDTNFGKFPSNSRGSIRLDSIPYRINVQNHQHSCSSWQTSAEHNHLTAAKQYHQTTTPHLSSATPHHTTALQQNSTVTLSYLAEAQHYCQIPLQHHIQNATQLFNHQHQNEGPTHSSSAQRSHYQSGTQDHQMATLQTYEPAIQENCIDEPLNEEILHPFIAKQSGPRPSTSVSCTDNSKWGDCVNPHLLRSYQEKSNIRAKPSIQIYQTGESASDIFRKNAALIKSRFHKEQDTELISSSESIPAPIKDVFHKNTDIMTPDDDEKSSSYSARDAHGTDQSSGSGGSVRLRDLLLLPSSYKDLSVFQKKYFPTNDYAENNYLNTILNIHAKSRPTAQKSELNGANKEQEDSTAQVKSTQDTVVSEKARTVNDSLCEVCGEKAAGFYCGAFVCEACKKFFMRAVKSKSVNFMCLRDKKCVITKENRVRCQYCRYMKCLELKMFSPGSNPEIEQEGKISQLPCQVCGAVSSGFHFGALTCEGCKGFFRRMTKERNPGGYQCLRDRNCSVTMTTRNVCKACRYKKCVDCGMSVSSSRIGRKPNIVKHALAVARKTSSLQSTTHRAPDNVAITTSSTSTSTPVPCSPSALASSALAFSSLASSSTQSTSNITAVTTGIDKKKAEDFWKILESDCYDVIEHIKKAATELDGILDQSYREKEDEADEYIDHKAVWNKLMKRSEIHIKCVIEFAKKVPGFLLLNIKTQMLMIKLSVYSIILLKMSEKYQPDNSVVLDFSMREAIQVHKYFPIIDLVETHLKHIGTMRNSLSLDKTETGIMAMLLLLDEECVSDEEKDTVSDIQEKIIECLKVYEEDNYNSGSVRYGVILLRLGEFSLASLQYGQALAGIRAMYPDLDIPQLFNDVILK